MTRTVAVPSGVRLALDDGGAGPAVLCRHGLAGCKELWAELLPLLRRAGFRAIAYDQRGHGESDDPPPPWSIADLAAHRERAMPRRRTVVVPDCHHYPMTDQPGAVAEALLAFLREARPDA
ncbi:MAG TPA: alpha/beta hydrolase [Chloroflexota bacterium]|nr:alpha/beta hydrolase [Chloroflexota bacterium]